MIEQNKPGLPLIYAFGLLGRPRLAGFDHPTARAFFYNHAESLTAALCGFQNIKVAVSMVRCSSGSMASCAASPMRVVGVGWPRVSQFDAVSQALLEELSQVERCLLIRCVVARLNMRGILLDEFSQQMKNQQSLRSVTRSMSVGNASQTLSGLVREIQYPCDFFLSRADFFCGSVSTHSNDMRMDEHVTCVTFGYMASHLNAKKVTFGYIV